MLKIIAAFDGLSFSQSTMEYAIHFTRELNAHLSGIFLDDPLRRSFSIYDIITEEDAVTAPSKIEKLEKIDTETRLKSAQLFEKRCQRAKIKFYVEHDTHIAIQDLLNETIFADLLIINIHETFSRYADSLPTTFIHDLLKGAHCPVLVVPDSFQEIENLIVLYDGSPSSVFAVKMFTYLFPEIDPVKTEILSLAKKGTPRETPDKSMMENWVKWHFSSVGYRTFSEDSSPTIIEEIESRSPNTMIIAGAYHRNSVSMLFHHSFADQFMKKCRLPLFIAHC